MKFANLFKKEIKELLTVQTIITMIVTMLVLVFVGNAFGGIIEDAVENAEKITICDKDDTELTKALIKALTVSKVNEETGMPEEYDESLVELVEVNSEDYAKELEKLGKDNVIIIPEGFSEKVMKGEKADIINLSKMTSSAMLSNISNNDSAVTAIREAVKQLYITSKGISAEDLAASEALVTICDKTIVADKSADVSSSLVSSLTSMQSMFLPIVVFILVMYASQMIIAAISTEKIDKTLETLLSAPVSRVTVLCSKMLAAGVVAAINAVVYMIGFSKMMDGMTAGSMDSANVDVDRILADLGLKLSTSGYVLLGIQMFLTILIALSVSLILGALAKDAKAAQTLVMPIMFMAMIPYILSMMMDIKELSPVLRYVIYAIPFTHTFIASENIMFNNMALYWGGVIYQLILLAICLTVAVKIFTTDRIFTMTLSFGDKSKSKSGKKKSLFKK